MCSEYARRIVAELARGDPVGFCAAAHVQAFLSLGGGAGHRVRN
jgi:hypothetical protein